MKKYNLYKYGGMFLLVPEDNIDENSKAFDSFGNAHVTGTFEQLMVSIQYWQ